jgi:hypothetical protein
LLDLARILPGRPTGRISSWDTTSRSAGHWIIHLGHAFPGAGDEVAEFGELHLAVPYLAEERLSAIHADGDEYRARLGIVVAGISQTISAPGQPL